MRLLMVEDDVSLSQAVRLSLEHAGYAVDLCHDGREGLRLALSGVHDILLIDRMLPGLDGMRLVDALRSAGHRAPVIMITALGGLNDRVDGLDAGADDYLVKPFEIGELLARLRALSRRPQGFEDAAQITFSDLRYDIAAKTVSGPKGACTLSQREGDLLEALMRSGGRTAQRDYLFMRVWGVDAEVENGNLDSYIHFLRRRLTAVGSRAKLKAAYGVGYRLEDGR